MKFDRSTYRLQDVTSPGKKPLLIGIVVLALSFLGYIVNSQQFFFSYLVAYVFWVSIGLGGLFFVMLSHMTGTVWGLVLRRIIESIMIALPYMALLFIPIIFGMNDLYKWSRPEVVATDHLLQHKAPYLNVPFFVVRNAVYFGIWYLLARKLYKTSLAQDDKPQAEQIKRMRKISGPGIVLFAVTTAFASFDWLMSLDAHWFSTIFGVYFFAGSFLGLLAFLVLLNVYLQRNDILRDVITVEHFHDIGKLLFSFTIFWGYMGFSQYFLIWYANIPEETVWFAHRYEGSWIIISWILVLANFLVPFIALMPRRNKRSIPFLTFISVWILVTHWIDLYWLSMPVLHHHGAHFSWMDITLTVAVGAIFVGIIWRHLASNALVPINDPKLEESIKFVNA